MSDAPLEEFSTVIGTRKFWSEVNLARRIRIYECVASRILLLPDGPDAVRYSERLVEYGARLAALGMDPVKN